jgi:pimeloyl-ACP methyl ester carboxylesterase
MTRIKIASIIAVVLFGAFAAWKVPAVLADSKQPRPACQQVTLSVKLAAGDPASYHLTGWLCANGGLAGKPVQLLMSGSTYDHNYWDLPYRPDSYSYVRAANQAGYATFNIDRLGVGQSDKPPAEQVTIPAEGFVAHQVVQDLRSGKVAGTRFSTVIGVGHSLGAAMWLFEAGSFSDVDGLILADYLHAVNPAQAAAITTTMYPAQSDPRFTKMNLPTGYLTTKPGTRAADFYNAKVADPAVVQADESTKATTTSGERNTMQVARDLKYSQAILVPILLVVGGEDGLACTAAPASGAAVPAKATPNLSCANSRMILGREHTSYATDACLSALVAQGAGHDTNLHPGARQWFITAQRWLSQNIGPSAAPGNGRPCTGSALA